MSQCQIAQDLLLPVCLIYCKQVVPSKYGIQILCVCSFVCFHLSIRNTEHKLLGKTNFNQNKLVNRYALIFAGGSAVKNLPANAGDAGSSLGQEDPLEDEMAASISVWESLMDRGACRLQSRGSRKSQTQVSQ